jgi:hypothetical protein
MERTDAPRSSATLAKSIRSPAKYRSSAAMASRTGAGGTPEPLSADRARNRCSVAAGVRSGSCSRVTPRSLQAMPHGPRHVPNT